MDEASVADVLHSLVARLEGQSSAVEVVPAAQLAAWACERETAEQNARALVQARKDLLETNALLLAQQSAQEQQLLAREGERERQLLGTLGSSQRDLLEAPLDGVVLFASLFRIGVCVQSLENRRDDPLCLSSRTHEYRDVGS